MIRIERILNIEDNVYKHVDIKRAMERICPTAKIDRQITGEEGIFAIEAAQASGHPYDLLILDMHFSINGESRLNAGEIVLEQLSQKGIELPIIICSSQNWKLPGTLGTAFYNDMHDLESDFRKILSTCNEWFE